jgi:predicted dehydrogenase
MKKSKTKGVRVKGGIATDGEGYYVIVHLWDNEAGHGKPEQFRGASTYETEAEAMAHYVENCQPDLHKLAEGLKLNKCTVNPDEWFCLED